MAIAACWVGVVVSTHVCVFGRCVSGCVYVLMAIPVY